MPAGSAGTPRCGPCPPGHPQTGRWLRQFMRTRSACCARAASGHAAAKAAIPSMNARRRIAAPKAQGLYGLCFGMTQLQQGFATDGMGFRVQVARQQSRTANVCFGWRVQPVDATPSNLARWGGVRWKGMHGHGLRRSRGLSFGSAGSVVNVWRISLKRLRGGTRAAFIGSWLSMGGSLHCGAGELTIAEA
jgi:hypothetical protein